MVAMRRAEWRTEARDSAQAGSLQPWAYSAESVRITVSGERRSWETMETNSSLARSLCLGPGPLALHGGEGAGQLAHLLVELGVGALVELGVLDGDADLAPHEPEELLALGRRGRLADRQVDEEHPEHLLVRRERDDHVAVRIPVQRPGVARVVVGGSGDDHLAGEGRLAAEALAHAHAPLAGHEVGLEPAVRREPQLPPRVVEQEDAAGGGRPGHPQRRREQGVEQVGHPQGPPARSSRPLMISSSSLRRRSCSSEARRSATSCAELAEVALALGDVAGGLQGVGDLAGLVAHRERDDLGVGGAALGVEAGVDGGGRLAGAEGDGAGAVDAGLLPARG